MFIIQLVICCKFKVIFSYFFQPFLGWFLVSIQSINSWPGPAAAMFVLGRIQLITSGLPNSSLEEEHKKQANRQTKICMECLSWNIYLKTKHMLHVRRKGLVTNGRCRNLLLRTKSSHGTKSMFKSLGVLTNCLCSSQAAPAKHMKKWSKSDKKFFQWILHMVYHVTFQHVGIPDSRIPPCIPRIANIKPPYIYIIIYIYNNIYI